MYIYTHTLMVYYRINNTFKLNNIKYTYKKNPTCSTIKICRNKIRVEGASVITCCVSLIGIRDTVYG